jgi:HSP20 family protein
MTEIKEAPKTTTGNGSGFKKDVARQAPTELQKLEARWFDFTRQFADEMDRAFADFGHESVWRLPRLFARGRKLFRHGAKEIGMAWSPRIDVHERDGKFIVHAELPGMKKDEVKVELFDDMLNIEGERKQEKNEAREGYSYCECRYGSFYRSVPLPEGVDTSKATADFRRGVLEVTMPVLSTAKPKARQIEIKETK